MSLWKNGFPATYGYQQPVFTPQPQMNNAFQNGNNQQFNQQQTVPQMMSPPTIRAEIIQVDSEDAASSFPVGAGASQMMIAKDDSAIFIKSAMANGQTMLDVFVKRPPAPPAPKFDPEQYVRRDEVETLVSAALAAQMGARRVSKKEGNNDESV